MTSFLTLWKPSSTAPTTLRLHLQRHQLNKNRPNLLIISKIIVIIIIMIIKTIIIIMILMTRVIIIRVEVIIENYWHISRVDWSEKQRMTGT